LGVAIASFYVVSVENAVCDLVGKEGGRQDEAEKTKSTGAPHPTSDAICTSTIMSAAGFNSN
jgi:hypothetical protein